MADEPLFDLPDDIAELTGTIDVELTEEHMRGCPEEIKAPFRRPPDGDNAR